MRLEVYSRDLLRSSVFIFRNFWHDGRVVEQKPRPFFEHRMFFSARYEYCP
jgi:hypothetical protein